MFPCCKVVAMETIPVDLTVISFVILVSFVLFVLFKDAQNRAVHFVRGQLSCLEVIF